MIYTGEKNVTLCLEYLDKTLRNITNNTINFINSKIIEPSAGKGAFYDALKYYDIVSYDTNPYPTFPKCIQGDFLHIEDIQTEKKYRIFLGFPPTRDYVRFIKHSFELGADVIAFIMPISATNKKNLKIYKDNGYTAVFNKPILSNDFTLPDKSNWTISANFIIIIKDEYVKKEIESNAQNKTYKDFFDVYTINNTILTIKETSQPNLFKNDRIPKNRKSGKPYKIMKDENGNKYYHQKGINVDKIKECQLFLPLRVFPSKQEGMIMYDTFYDDTFAKIGFGLKTKPGYSVRKVKGKIIYYIYREMYKGILTLVAKLDNDAVKNFYATQRYNNGVFVSSKKLIQANRKGIL
jgi:hypothetical protein